MKVFISTIFILSVFFVGAQPATPSLNNSLVPPSPDVAALGKYGIQPVTLYSGMANVSVPITEIKTTKLSLPISLNYNYNGYKPSEVASSIGLGWSLQAGGVITRIVKGKADDAAGLIHKWEDYADIVDLKSNPDFLSEVGSDQVDTEPDIYIFNFSGYSGKFIMVGNRAFLFPKQNLNIVGLSGAGFKIYTADGTIYDFQDKETTTFPISQGGATYTSAWNLSSIKSSDLTDAITLQYINWTYRTVATYYTDILTQKGSGGPIGTTYCSNGCISWSSNSYSISTIASKLLIGITSKTTKINFIQEATTRLDITSAPSTPSTATALKEITIFSQPNNKLVKKVLLTHGYLGPTDNNGINCHLKLGAVNIRGYKTLYVNGTETIDSITEPPYTFIYHNEQEVFSKSTRGIDRWGYYNGVNSNTNLFDYKLDAPMDPADAAIYKSANREVNIASSKNGILTKMTYPTGGYTDFEYENNYVRIPGVSNDVLENQVVTLTKVRPAGNPPPNASFSVGYFNVNHQQNITVDYSRIIDFQNYCAGGCPNTNPVFKLYLLDSLHEPDDPNALPPLLVFSSPALGGNTSNPSATSANAIVNLVRGNYMFRVTCDLTSLSATATVRYTKIYLDAYMGDPGPGLRIKSINSFANTTTPIIENNKNYTYGKGATLVNFPTGYRLDVTTYIDCPEYRVAKYYSDFSTYLNSLFNDQFYYPVVTEINKNAEITGKTIYEFQSNTDAVGVKLTKQSDYAFNNNNYEIVKSKTNIYGDPFNGANDINFRALTTKVSDIFSANSCSYGLPYLWGSPYDTIGRTKLFTAEEYYLYSTVNLLLSTVDKSYNLGQPTALTVQTNNYYDNPAHLNPTKSVLTNSKGDIITTQLKYPLDYNFTGCLSLSATDNNFKTSRTNISNAYNTCRINRVTAALASGIPNGPYHPLSPLYLAILRQWKCEENSLQAYAPIKNSISSSITSVNNCYDPAFQPFPAQGIITMQRNNVQSPVEQITSINKNGVEYLQSATKTDYAVYVANGIYGATPKTIYQTTFSSTPVLKSDFLANPTNYYKPRVDFKYNSKGNITEQSKLNDAKETYIWDYNDQNATAKIVNADSINVAATSFESNGTGKFNFTGTSAIDANSITGNKTYALSTGNITKTSLDAAKTYIVSYWSDNGVKTISGATLTHTGRSLNGFTYYEHKVVNPAAGTITISGIGKIDELRLYPDAAQMMTYTYESLIGITSQCDANNKITYYEYDALSRLILVRDQDKNVLKKYCYNYAGQPENCLVNCNNTTANWQNTTTALRCQVDANAQYTGYQEQEQKDMNVCSSSFGQSRWVVIGQNTATCPVPILVPLTSTNTTNFAGYTASYYNTVTGITYNFAVSSTAGLNTLGSIPEGVYNLTITKTGNQYYSIFKSGCNRFQTVTGLSAVFNNIGIYLSSTFCKSITINLDLSFYL
jgi:YD repeat-containing protein